MWAYSIRMSVLSEQPKDVCSKNKDWKGKVRSQELEQKHANEKVFAMS